MSPVSVVLLVAAIGLGLLLAGVRRRSRRAHADRLASQRAIGRINDDRMRREQLQRAAAVYSKQFQRRAR